MSPRLFLCLVLLTTPAAASTNLLMNPSFEDGAVHDAYGSMNWTPFGAVFNVDDTIIPLVEAQDGDFYLKMFGPNSGVFQDHAIAGSTELEASLYVMNAAFDPMLPGCVGFARLEYFDAGSGFISATDSSLLDHTLPSDTWTQVTIDDTAPANAATVRFVALGQCSAGGAVMFDSASLSVPPPPEPETIPFLDPWQTAALGVVLLGLGYVVLRSQGAS
ncbi:MAG: hypothetical protein AAF533_22740 [Acidobacteriota bacterium]